MSGYAGETGNTGATGATGRWYGPQGVPIPGPPDSQPPCDGPVGEDAAQHLCVSQNINHYEKSARVI